MSQGFVNPYTYATSAPTVTTYTSGSGTYTTPAGVKFLVVELVGGGGGGGGSGTGGQGTGATGGTTSFGSASGTGGVGGLLGGAGGTGSGGTLNLAGAQGAWGGGNSTAGGSGGLTVFGGSAAGGNNAPGNGSSAQANSGSGGGGAGGGATVQGSYGGGAGGFVQWIITSPSATYSYSIGAGGAGGAAGTSGAAGGNGGSGVIYIYEYYEVLGIPTTLTLPLAVAQGGTGVVTSTGTGSTVLNVSPTLTTPIINQINDTNGNANLAIYAATNAVNYMTSFNSPTGGFTGFEVTGADTNANAYMKPKGDAGFAVVTSAVAAVPFAIYSGTTQQHVTTFTFSNTNAVRNVTWPDLTGTVNMGLATGGICAWVNFDGGTSPGTIRASSNVTSVTRNSTGNFTVNITNALADANYAVSITTGAGSAAASDAWGFQAAPTSTAFRFATGTSAGANTNYTYTTCTIVR